MPRLIYRAAIAHAFGRGSARPVRAASMRLACLTAGALSLGLLFAWTAHTVPIAPATHPSLLFFSCALIVQTIVAVTLLSGTSILSDDSDTFARLLRVLPLGPAHCSVLVLLPTLMLAGLALLLTVPPLVVLMHALAVPPPLAASGIAVGVMSGLGVARGASVAVGVRLACVAAIIGAEYKLNATLFAQHGIQMYAVLAYALLLTSLVGLGIHTVLRHRSYTPSRSHSGTIRTAWIAPAYWPIKQLLRRKSMALSLGVGLLLSVGLAVFAKRQGVADPVVLGLLGALLAGSFASDTRALARRFKPAEITALRGTLYFAGMQTLAACFGGLIIAAPLLWALYPAIPLVFVTQIALGISVGLLSGTLIVPEARDIMSQFLAIILILGLLVGMPQLPVMSDLPASGRALTDIAVMLTCLASAVVVESKRNNYIWRNTHHAQ